jgi:hypothetical protein
LADAGLGDAFVEDVVVHVPDENAVALGIRSRALDRCLPTDECRHLRVLHDLAAEAEPEVLGEHTRCVRHQADELWRRGRGSTAAPLVAVRVRICAGLPLRRQSV